MKNILIITYCTSPNAGTLLQAYGVYSAMKTIYPNAQIDFFKVSRPEKKRKRIYYGLWHFLQITYGRILSYYRRKLYYSWSEEHLPRSKYIDFGCWNYCDEKYKKVLENYDLISIGSDTVLDTIFHNDRISVTWGRSDIKAKQIFFAASGDDCNNLLAYRSFYDILRKNLEHFSYIGLRDHIIKDFLTNTIHIDEALITLQPDPTYYLPLNIFKLRKKYVDKINDIVGKKAIFHFSPSCAYRKELSILLKEMGYKLISPEYDPHCDINLGVISPIEWGDMFKYVDVVFTERFHDTVFALRHCTPVINFDWNNHSVYQKGQSKRTEILSIYGLEDYNIRVFCGTIDNELKEKIQILIRNFDCNRISKRNDELIQQSNIILTRIYQCLI